MTPFPDGLSAGVETNRSYTAQEFPGGSQRTVTSWLKILLDQPDVLRVWLTPVGSKDAIWEHRGPLNEMPDLDHLFVTVEELAAA